jgi:enamine deaminase RidA (YjgF/YER057c/UK114 family)
LERGARLHQGTATEQVLPIRTVRLSPIFNDGLPEAPSPLGAYVTTSKVDSLLFLSGMIPLVHGKLAFPGRLGADLTIDQGREAAKLAALNALSVANVRLPGLDRVKGVVRLAESMATTLDFMEHAAVADGASELFVQVFGKDPGHTRLVSGVQSLPLGAPLVLEVIFQVDNA